MARNEEKQFCKLNRLILQKEKEEYEKKNPQRPRLDCLDTVEEIQKWLPSIKLELEFYLKKLEVICYSDHHIEECKEKVVHLEKEYKAFVRKIARLTPGKLEAIPWTNRAYKRKNMEDPAVTLHNTKGPFIPIHAPILKREKMEDSFTTRHNSTIDMPYMDEPLSFKPPCKSSVDSAGSSNESSECTGSRHLGLHSTNGQLASLVDYLDSDGES